MQDKHWEVHLRVFSFDNQKDADDYREALTNAFMDMHESAPYASLASTVCVDDTD